MGCAMLVKICGITRLGDAVDAVNAGARALGFVFWPDSPRFIDPYRARAIAAGLRHFLLVAAERGAMGAGRSLSRADAAGDAV